MARNAGRDWTFSAACGSAEADLFFPISASFRNLTQVTEAKALCDICLVRRECLDFAVRTRQMHGIWGGMTEEERYPLIRARQEASERPVPGAARTSVSNQA